ncbi:pyrimidine-nucleoside phosphorylase [Pullulanibacillus camelliae]|uniref:Pyrimidine-nucleoside phosphorylase n=1 Tax=Pullulanibacillus camelliae TaxID=1707096 RepID=A0A8J2VLF6_9BACL|nr:pyrimidine-nucleoside phosphorylase [Pullulanibacillus camelliae]GGE29871.1 pyrimidine-nucleoside phosphorylase [Pullulanibacillus camelliae]
MRIVECIEKKRDGKQLSTEEIQFIIKGYTEGEIPDYQMSALAMAIYFQGMSTKEVADLTMAMVHSGDTIDLSSIDGVKVDKHSTGGVGDTTTLILAPLVAALDVPVAKMSGRGLGHTGGTIDKLESVPGFHVELDNEQFVKQVNQNKIAVVGQSGNLTPADKKLYALRDVTGTVNSIPLIASSIMSKKIAAGADAIVLDVKTGSGAFMKDLDGARALAQTMVQIGNSVGRQAMAVISDMSQPLGFAIGNALEVKEAIDTLKGQGPKDLEKLCLTLGSQMVYLAGKAASLEEAEEKLKAVMANGRALEKFKVFLQSQGGDSSIADDPSRLPQAQYQIDILAEQSGVISEIVADTMGVAAMHLGAGRITKETVIDLAVGIVLHKKIGDKVKKGDALLTIHANTQELDEVKTLIHESIKIADKAERPTLIYDIIKG